MTRRAYLYFTLTFLLGVIVGAAGVFFYGWYGGRWHRGFEKQHMVRRLTRELNLSDAQVQQLGQLIDGSIKRYSELQAQVEPQYRAVGEETRKQIRQILTPEQATKFDELVRRWEERRKKHAHPP
jgi:Spy/CpxP family protein refolding chaperone